MTDRTQRDEEIEVIVELDEDADDEQGERGPQPGNTPAPGEPSLDSGAITGGDLADDQEIEPARAHANVFGQLPPGTEPLWAKRLKIRSH